MRTWSRTGSRTSVRTFDRTESGGLPPVAGDPYFNYTTLLLPGNGTNGAQNNTFLDSSTNAFSITRNGNTTQGTFSPFSQTGWGNYFDGSGDYLSGPTNNAVSTFTGDFTIEAWFNFSSIAADCTIAACIEAGPPELGWLFRWRQAGLDFRFYSSALGSFDFPYTPTVGAWTHVAISRSGTDLKCFINGTQIGSTQTASGTITRSTVNPLTVGGGQYAATSTNGYLSNVRIVNGTAVYTAAFTPPTAPLTAIANTSLLTCQSNRFIDNSSNAFAITRNGDVSVQAFSPFNPTAAWSAATNGGSGYFDGSGDYLTTASSTSLALGSGDFTVDVWFYPTTTNTYFLIDFRTGCTLYFYVTSGTTVNVAIGGNSETTFSGVVTNAWNHFACVRSGSGSNNVSYYLNGVRGAQQTDTTNFSSATTITLGKRYIAFSGNDFYLQGYLGSTRLVVGSAVYSGATYTVPTAPLTAITNTQLLCNFTNAGIYDATAKNDLETVGNAQISTTQSKFGGSSISFDGSGDYLYPPIGQTFNSGTGDFTFECWAYFNSVATGVVIGAATSGGSVSGAFTLYISASGVLRLYGPSVSGTTTSSVATGTWYHLAVTRSGNTFTLWVDGVSAGTFTDSGSINGNNALCPFGIGKWPLYAGFDLNAYLQDVRFTRGIARYTTGFTPPTTAFPVL